MIHLRPDLLEMVRQILAEHVPHCEVRLFGSRYYGTHREASDVDLAIVGEGRLDWRTLARLTGAFEESNLPFRVDVLDWYAISPEFQRVIEQGYEMVQRPIRRV